MAVHIGIPRDPGRVCFSEPYLRVDIEERDARHFRPGSYAYFPKDELSDRNMRFFISEMNLVSHSRSRITALAMHPQLMAPLSPPSTR